MSLSEPSPNSYLWCDACRRSYRHHEAESGHCPVCGGVLKPDVVFFGENVPPPVVAHCYGLVDQARALLVLGSSLSVMSGLRFVRKASALGKPVVIVNQGWTRGDDLATLKLDVPLGPTLREV